jgi:hypothetical protein
MLGIKSRASCMLFSPSYRSGHQKSLWAKIKVSGGLYSLERTGGEDQGKNQFLAFQIFESTYMTWHRGLFHFQNQQSLYFASLGPKEPL